MCLYASRYYKCFNQIARSCNFLDESKMCDNIMKYCSDSVSILIVCGNENYVGEKDYSH